MLKLNYPYLEVSRDIDSVASEVWRLIIDTARWPQWGPSVRAVECGDRLIHQGSTGRIQTRFGLWVNFEIAEFENDRYWSWRVGGLQATGHRVEPLEKFRTRLIFEIPLVVAPYAVVCKMALNRIVHLLE